VSIQTPTKLAPALSLSLFGSFNTRLGDKPLPRLRSRKGESLVAMLALRGDAGANRHWLAGTLWPDSDESLALYYLRRELSALRNALGDQSFRLIGGSGGKLALNLTGATCDVLAFDAAVSGGDETTLQQAVELYRGMLLEGCSEEWVVSEREPRELAFLAALEKLANLAFTQGDFSTAAAHLRKVLNVDPLRETAQRALLRALAGQGDYAAAVQSYRELRLRLRDELNTEPDPETTAVFRGISEAARLSASQKSSTPVGPPVRRLPTPITELVGRRDELREIAEAVASSRLVCLTGSGGIGKTRLAIQSANLLADGFQHGAWFVDFAAISEPAMVPQTVAAALEIRAESGKGISQAIVDALRSKQILIVLDNCEQILDACSQLAGQLLSSCSGVRILATSRQPLGISGEVAWRVPSLEVPPIEPVQDRRREKDVIAELMDFGSVRLFSERAGQAVPGFRITKSNCQDICEICRQLDGIPLAIELAAARIRTLSVAELLRRLEDRFGLLTTGSRSALPRQQTLRAAIEWSFDLLTSEERELFSRLTVFAGSWSLSAAEFICSSDGLPREAILNAMSGLVDKSLAIRFDKGEESRYRFLETVREFGKGRLNDVDRKTIQLRHAEYYLDFVKATNQGIDGPQYDRLICQLDMELDNLRAAMASSIRIGDGERALGIAYRVQRYWSDRGAQAEGRTWIQHALDVSSEIPPNLRGHALKVLGQLSFEQADFDTAQRAYEEALSIYDSNGDQMETASICNDLGCLSQQLGDYEASRRHFLAACAVNRDLGLTLCVAMNMGNLGMIASDCGEFERALELLDESCALAKSVEAKRVIPGILAAIGGVLWRMGENERSQSVLNEALTITRDNDNRFWEPGILNKMAMLAVAEGELDNARRGLEQSLLVAGPAGNRREVACAAEVMADLEMQVGDLGRAVLFYSAADYLRTTIRSPLPPCDKARHDSALESLRTQFGANAFEERWQEGQSFTVDRIIDLAVRH
jgi:predicted ATPase/DNA-binding SARP family transcriptional activator